MKKPVTFNFAETPLSDAIASLGRDADVLILLDPGAVDAKLATATLQRKGMPLQTALDAAIKPFSLTCALKDEGILVTTPQRALDLRSVMWRFYDLRHLDRKRAAAAQLALAIRKACQAHPEWAPSHRIAEYKNRLVIRSTPAVHAVVQKLVEDSVRSAPRP
jgi:hypothetical protein